MVVLTYKPNGEVTACEALPGRAGDPLGKNNFQGKHGWLQISVVLHAGDSSFGKSMTVRWTWRCTEEE